MKLTGIIRCDMIAESIIAAADELGPLRVPIVVRLQGTNAEQGQKMVRIQPTLSLSPLIMAALLTHRCCRSPNVT